LGNKILIENYEIIHTAPHISEVITHKVTMDIVSCKFLSLIMPQLE